MRRYIFLILLAGTAHADRLGSLRSNADVRLTTQTIAGDNLGNHIATMTLTTPYGIAGSTMNFTAFDTSLTSMTVDGADGLKVLYGVTVGTLTTLGAAISGPSNNTDSILNIFKTNASAGDYIMSLGTNQQIDQFVLRDQFPLVLNVFGVRAGTLNVGLSGFNDKIMSANSIDQHINMWNSGDLIIQSGLATDGGKEIIFKPRTIEALRISNTTGITAVSSMTLTAAGGLGVTYGVTVGSITINSGGSSGQTVCWKTGTTLGFCSSAVGAGGACTCN